MSKRKLYDFVSDFADFSLEFLHWLLARNCTTNLLYYFGDRFSYYRRAQEGTFTYFFPSSQLFQLDKVFYAGLAYLVIYTIVYSVARFIGIFIHLVPNKKANERWYNVASGVLALCVTLFGIQMFLTVLATIPLPVVQNHLNTSSIARFIISHTPITSGVLKQLWVTKIIG